ncbi:type II toxin-antitoxin system RelE/ParE family toxin [Hallella seregens]|uniref:Type II toxin-antitoxin system RelE/ParE family toxin n=1 Tax=Hallella seregens ATCC 51272 TaxID=1336250 RepID=A0ABV5ZI33_9BACT|nr:type II toxin-antitoxin system RelE/ParE family toxin [Hallella seregens]
METEQREIFYSPEYEDYYGGLPKKVQQKYDYVEQIIRTQRVVNQKFVKHLENTFLYEARVSTGGNEYRTIVFAIDSRSLVESRSVLFLNSFLKKDTKQYGKEIDTAIRILNRYTED